MTKVCTLCKTEKEKTEFNKDRSKMDGLRSQCRPCQHLHYKENKNAYAKRWKIYYKENREVILERANDYYKEHGGRIAESRRGCPKIREYNRERLRNPDIKKRIQEYGKRHYENNREMYFEKSRNRRAKVASVGGKHSRRDVRFLMHIQRQACAICDRDISGSFHVDHIIPISKGGWNNCGNIQLLCPSCNLSKADKLPIQHKAQLIADKLKCP